MRWGIGVVIAMLAMRMGSAQPLPSQIIAEGQWIVADLDGTLVGAPVYPQEPTLDESSAKESICRWLELGGNLLVITGSEKERVIERFLKCIPQEQLKEALTSRHLVLSANTGAVLCYFDGEEWVEDERFSQEALGRPIAIASSCEIIARAQAITNRFYEQVAQGQIILTHYPLIEKVAKERYREGVFQEFTTEELLSFDQYTIPRIEVRRLTNGVVVQIVLKGVPASYLGDCSLLKVDESVEVYCSGSRCEIDCAGVDKRLPMDYLEKQTEGYPLFVRQKSIAVGDRPAHLDRFLIDATSAFVSVCEKDLPAYIPHSVKYRLGGNEQGADRLIRALIAFAEKDAEEQLFSPVLTTHLEEAVSRASQKE